MASIWIENNNHHHGKDSSGTSILSQTVVNNRQQGNGAGLGHNQQMYGPSAAFPSSQNLEIARAGSCL